MYDFTTNITKSPRPSASFLRQYFSINAEGQLVDVAGKKVGRSNTRTGYLQVHVGKKLCYVHHILYILQHGAIPASRKVEIHGDRRHVVAKNVHLSTK